MNSLRRPQIAEDSISTAPATPIRIRPVYQLCKRFLDIVGSASLILILAPLWLLLAILIKSDSSGPVFFVCTVVGLHGVEFSMYKFRSMRPNSRQKDHIDDLESNFRDGTPTTWDDKGPIYKTALKDQSRITRIGRFLRRTSLDELPQLWNILLGQMSFIGPRPSLPEEARLYSDDQRQRFLVRPGITGLYQVTARHRVSIEEMIRIDLDYIRRQSFLLDLKILFKTPAAMFSGV